MLFLLSNMFEHKPIEMPSFLERSGCKLPIVYKAHKQAKSYRLRLSKDHQHVVITLPPFATQKGINEFIKFSENWLGRVNLSPTAPIVMQDGANVVLLEEVVTLKFEQSREEETSLDDGVLLVSSSKRRRNKLLQHFFYQYLLHYVMKRSQNYARHLGVSLGEVAVKDFKSKWGTCDHKRNLKYAWRLIFAPKEIVDYVCAHEVAHIKEMSHNKAFWQVVQSLYPNYKVAERWLKINGRFLFRYVFEE